MVSQILGEIAGDMLSKAFGVMAAGKPALTAEVERACKEAGLAVAERRGDQLVLKFDTRRGVRAVNVFVTPAGRFAAFLVRSEFDREAEAVQPNLLAHLLVRNGKSEFGAWQLSERANGNPMFTVHQTLPVAGLTGAMVAAVCSSLLDEADDLDARLEQAGLL